MSDEHDTDGQRNARDEPNESDLKFGRREVMSAFGSVGFGGAFAGSASVNRADNGARVGNRPWDADVDADGNRLRNLGANVVEGEWEGRSNQIWLFERL